MWYRIIAIALPALGQIAFAFDMADCVAVSQAEPYSMSAGEAREACEAKNAASGEADTRITADTVPIERPEVGAGAVSERIRAYMRTGRLKMRTCIGASCRNRYPSCPEGYTLLKPTAGPYITGAYHRRYWLRSVGCLKN